MARIRLGISTREMKAQEMDEIVSKLVEIEELVLPSTIARIIVDGLAKPSLNDASREIQESFAIKYDEFYHKLVNEIHDINMSSQIEQGMY